MIKIVKGIPNSVDYVVLRTIVMTVLILENILMREDIPLLSLNDVSKKKV